MNLQALQKVQSTIHHINFLLDEFKRHEAQTAKFNRWIRVLREAALVELDAGNFEGSEKLRLRLERICARHCKVLDRQIAELDALGA
jgi:hypothetical protein